MRLSTLLDRCRAEIGYTENPPGSNRTKFAVLPIEVGQPWCGTFVDAMFAGSGLLPGSMFYTPAGAQRFKSANRWSIQPAPGRVVFFSFRPDRVISHVAIVEELIGTSAIQTIEGNTSANYVGSQDNGGGVFRRVRPRDATIIGYGIVTYEPEEDMADKLIRKTSTGEINVYEGGQRTPVGTPGSPNALGILTKMQAAGLVQQVWVELDDETFDAIPRRP